MLFTAWKHYTKETDKGKSIYCDSMAINNITYSVLHKKNCLSNFSVLFDCGKPEVLKN